RTPLADGLDFYCIAAAGDVATLPYSLRIVLENLLRHEDGVTVTADDIRAVVSRDRTREIQLRPARVLMQDFTGVPAICDLAAMREAARTRVDPLRPVDLVIDHSVQIDEYGTP